MDTSATLSIVGGTALGFLGFGVAIVAFAWVRGLFVSVTGARRPRLAKLYYGYWLIVVAFLAQFVSAGAGGYLIGTFFVPMTQDLGWTRSEFTLARTLAQFVTAITGFIVGAQVDRYGSKPFMLVGIFILSGAMFMLGSVHELWQWMVINGLAVTVGSAMIGNLVVNTTLSKWFVQNRGLAISVGAMGISFAGVAMVPPATYLIDTAGWRDAWRVLGVAAFVLILPLAFVMRRAPEDYGLNPDGKTDEQMATGGGAAARADFTNSFTRGEALRTVSFYMLVAGFGLFAVTVGVMLLQAIPFMTDNGYSRGTASFIISLTSLPAVFSKPVWGYFTDKTDPRRLAAAAAAVTGLALLVITLSIPAHRDVIVYPAFFALGCGWGGMLPLQETIWASFFGRRHIGAVRSTGLPFALFLGAGAPLLASYYFDRVGNYDGAFMAIAGLNCVAAVMLFLVPRPKRRAPAAVAAKPGMLPGLGVES